MDQSPTRLSTCPLKEAMDRSVTKLEREDAEIPTLEGYNQWRADCGGVYSITVAEVIKIDEYTLNKGLGCEPSKEPSSKSSP